MFSRSLLLFLLCGLVAARAGEEPSIVRSIKNGPWSSAATWEGAHIPAAGERVLIAAGTAVTYDVSSDTVIRSISIAGTLTFSRAIDTKLCVGLMKIQPGADTSEDGFDCHLPSPSPPANAPVPALEIGTQDAPIPAGHTALIRLTYVKGLDAQSCPAIIDCGGRMDLHGAPMPKTWVKLGRTNENSGDTQVELAEIVTGWKKGDRIVITGTRRQFPGYYGNDSSRGNFTKSVGESPQSEMGIIGGLREEHGHTIIDLDEWPLANRHEGGGEYAGEVANLSRNVIIESADPKGIRGHTMYHTGSTGSISYAEFRHLGKEGVKGRYPIHFHICGDSMRGSSVIGASIWDSANRFVTIHATDYLVVRDCVGFRSIGHGYFLESGSETRNILDHNLACLCLRGKPLPGQDLPFDQNDGAGFWWANSLNTFTRNVSVENDQHGYRFEVIASPAFNPVRGVLQPDGTFKGVDIRTLPFIRFDDNEAHCQRRFGMNLGGYNGLSDLSLPDDDKLQDVGGVGPDSHHPFIMRNLKLWDCDWAYHSGSPSVQTRHISIHRVLYGVWRINASLQEHQNLEMSDVLAAGFYFPRSVSPPLPDENRSELDPKDDLPPSTVITHVQVGTDGVCNVEGVASDNSEIRTVTVNGLEAQATRPNFAEWRIALPAPAFSEGKLVAQAVDEFGNKELTPHRIAVPRPGIAWAAGSVGF